MVELLLVEVVWMKKEEVKREQNQNRKKRASKG
jgi:hypothetical protein